MSCSVISPSASATAALSSMIGNAIDCRRADGAELELVAREGERRRAVAVGVVLLDLRQLGDAELDASPARRSPASCRRRSSSITRVSISPMNTEMIAGGASLAPSRCSLPLDGDAGAEQARVLVHALEHRGEEDEEADVLVRRLAGLEQVDAVELGLSARDRHATSCSACREPLMPANGFSCRSACRPWRSATLRSIAITSWLWSTAMSVSSKIGAISNWHGATSLCRVTIGTPSLYSSCSTSAMHAWMRSGMPPK